ncbi:MAG: DEAD/DEAH box helicase [Moraxellaceae bacterium]|nr:DEAD/DEAH box helicase [Moraxellaceae bacterium]
MSFSELSLHESLQRALADAGYTEPTPVQQQAIPAALEGKDLIVSAQTGTGKTAAFMLPALSLLADEPRKTGRGPRVLVLTPTRELAQQVTAATQKYGSELKNVRTVSVLGGMPFPAQNRLLSRPYDIMVATPGRLLDHMSRGRIVFERLEMLVLDEADRMLDMGFIDDVEQIAAACPPERQTLLFSATVEDRMAKLAANLLRDPVRIAISGQTAKHEQIEQRAYYADDLSHKKQLLLNMLGQEDVNQAIVFTSTRIDSDALADELAGFGIVVDSLHGDMKQTARNRTLTSLRSGRTKVLVATDVAARGIDVPGISHVINYDLPKNAEDYVHRIGRTGRAGRTGIASSLVGPRDRGVLRRIEQFINQTIPVLTVEGLEPKRRVDNDRPRRAFADKPRWDHKDRQAREDRPARHFGDRKPRDFGDRAAAPRTAGFGENRRPDVARAAREPFNEERQPLDNSNRPAFEGFRKPREGGFGERRPYAGAGAGATGDRKPRDFGDRKPREGGFAERRPYAGAGATGDRKPREGGFGEARSYGDRPPRAPQGDRAVRAPQAGERKARDFGGDRKPREGFAPRAFGDRPRRPLDDSFGNR